MSNIARLPRLPARPVALPLRDTVRETMRERGYVLLYREGMDCPGCGYASWHIGRQSAECACCGTALSLAHDRSAL